MGSKLVQINTVCNTSTGQIMHDIQTAAQKGYETLNTLLDCQGHGSYFVTRRLIKRLREEKPDRRKIAEHGSRYKRQSMTDKILKLYEGLQ